MKIEHSAPDTIRVSDLAPGDVFQFDSSFYIIIDGSASDQNCVELETGHLVLDFSRDISDGPVSHVPDATFIPHGRSSSES